jgi:hypothetical protein
MRVRPGVIVDVFLGAFVAKEIWRYEPPEGLKKLMALRANTGALDTSFGDGGQADLEIAYSGVPAIYKNVVRTT